MGILDDAIREHLELKRKHGAASSDLERLEKEAFGPPARPGDPDFEGSDELEGSEAETTLAEAPPADTSDDVRAPEETEGEGEDDSIGWLEEVDFDEAAAEAEAQQAGRTPDEEAEDADVTPAEQARTEHPQLQDTVDHPALERDEDARGEEPPSPPEAEIFGESTEAEEIDLGDLDLDLDLDDEARAASPEEARGEEEAPFEDAAREHALPEPEPESGAEMEAEAEAGLSGDDDLGDEGDDEAPRRAIFDLEEDEEDYEDRVDELEASYDEDTGPAEERVVERERAEVDDDEADDDLLEETPDFLQDAPEGERLWFEQGEPKDFDFDD
jgi:hypothetical protein